MKTRITPPGFSVGMTYDDNEPQLIVVSAGRTATYDEWEVDNLLRVVEHAQDPIEDLTDFFREDFSATAYRVAVQFHDHACTIAGFVYA